MSEISDEKYKSAGQGTRRDAAQPTKPAHCQPLFGATMGPFGMIAGTVPCRTFRIFSRNVLHMLLI